MADVNFISVAVGVVGAVAGVYFRESLRLASRQKTIAFKLRAQIHDLLSDLLKAEGHISFLLFAETWRKERIASLKRGATKAFSEVDKEYKNKLNAIKQEIEAGNKQIDAEIEKQYKTMREMPDKLFQYYIAQYEIVRDLLLNDKGLITENEAAELSSFAVSHIVSIRNRLIKLIHLNITLAMMMREMAELDLAAIRGSTFNIVEASIEACLHVIPLQEVADRLTAIPKSRLILYDMLGRDRF